ncbi:MAG: LamG domain-containing protein, partial [Akkermansiaceae bacterium]|nr:LamG domain-containing protein [Akkermansiaceae bacterium]
KALPADLTISAWIHPGQTPTSGRIIDNISPGGANGFLLDILPGNQLRFIAGSTVLTKPGILVADQWQHLAVTVDAAQGSLRLYHNGRQVAESTVATGDDTFVLSQAYALQRFITACAGRGSFPIKFNGSIFTVPNAGSPGDGDYRRWGPGYWWQNTRLPYLSLCTSGDFEMLEPLFRMYVDELLPFNQYRTKQYFGFEGAYFAECIHFWGDVFNETYGWTPVAERKDPLQESGYHKWEWVAGPELVWMMLDAYDHTGDEKLLTQRILPTADAVIRFFDNYYQTNAHGELVMHPAQALETWWDCTNPMPELAGLKALTTRLLALPETTTTPEARAYWQSFAAKLAPLPTRDVPGGKALAPATKFAAKRNSENPELYAVFPFRLCSFEKDNRDLGIQALKHRWDRGNFGWRQDDLFMAYLGLADEARQLVVGRARNHDKNSRFPAFWGPNYDWVPAQDHGGVLMKAVQSMLMQTEGRTIYLLPAWPKEWDVSFKLHAPYQTTLEGVWRDGRIQQLKVTPESRQQDVQIIE